MHPQSTTVPEEWRPVPIEHFKDVYFVSNLGRVRRMNRDPRLRAWKILQPFSQWHGYLLVQLNCTPHRQSVSVHRLVALAFLGAAPVDHEVNHIDGNKTNNRADNLEWVTRRENLADADRRGLTRRGESSGSAKVTEQAVREIRASSESSTARAARYGLSLSGLCSVRHRKTWRHVP